MDLARHFWSEFWTRSKQIAREGRVLGIDLNRIVINQNIPGKRSIFSDKVLFSIFLTQDGSHWQNQQISFYNIEISISIKNKFECQE